MNDQHAKTLQVPFGKAVMAAIAISKLINDQLRHATSEAEANANAPRPWTKPRKYLNDHRIPPRPNIDPDPAASKLAKTKTNIMSPINQVAPHQTYIKDACGDPIAIGTEPGLTDIVIRGALDVWYFQPDQAVSVAHAILSYVNQITGQRYVVGTITTGEPIAYVSEDEDTGPR